jgi:hypothetical protein
MYVKSGFSLSNMTFTVVGSSPSPWIAIFAIGSQHHSSKLNISVSSADTFKVSKVFENM